MADDKKKENELLSQSQENIDVDRDFLRVVDKDGISYADYMSDIARTFIEGYDGSVLAGSERSVKDAFGHISGAFSILQTAVNSNTSNISSIEDRICTSSELTLLEQKLGLR